MLRKYNNKPMNKKIIGIIPARYGSSRFPGKPLAMLGEKPMIQHVYERASSALSEVAVATDDDRIFKVVNDFGGVAVMTSTEHRSGTDRCLEAYEKLGSDADVIINIQGDEPFIAKSQIESVVSCFNDDSVRIASLARLFDKSKGFEALFDPNLVKVVMDSDSNALYFSRAIIPYVRSCKWNEWLEHTQFYTHVGLYAYTADTLRHICGLQQSSLELSESLEQLRWLQAGYKIRMAQTTEPNFGIDTPDDLAEAERFLKSCL